MIAIAGGGGVNLFNSMGNAWTADYLKITGELDVDLRSNIAAEARAKIVYERLINFCDDAGTKDALQFLMTREITHMKAFALALESMGKPPFMIGRIAPTPGLVDQFFNDSTGKGDHGEIDTRGPWNEGEPGNSSNLRHSRTSDRRCRRALPIHAESSDLAATRPLAGAPGRSASRHPARGKAIAEGPAENGGGGALRAAAATCSSCIWKKRRSRSSGSTNASTSSATPPAPSPAKA